MNNHLPPLNVNEDLEKLLINFRRVEEYKMPTPNNLLRRDFVPNLLAYTSTNLDTMYKSRLFKNENIDSS